jgi:mRNA interferase HicA
MPRWLLTVGQECPKVVVMRGNEFIRYVQVYAKKSGISCEWHPELGKGSHGVLILGNCRTVVRNPKDELKIGTFHAMLKQLGLRRNSF